MRKLNGITDNPFLITSRNTTNGRKHMEAIVQINRPVLTAEERAKRVEEIKQAAAALLIATDKSKNLRK